MATKTIERGSWSAWATPGERTSVRGTTSDTASWLICGGAGERRGYDRAGRTPRKGVGERATDVNKAVPGVACHAKYSAGMDAGAPYRAFLT